MIKRILIYLYGEQDHTATITAAARCAKQNEALISACYVENPSTGMHHNAGSWLKNQASVSARDEEYQKLCLKQCQLHGVALNWYRAKSDERLPQPLSYSDLIFVSQPSSLASNAASDIGVVDYLIHNSGIAIVLIPQDWNSELFATKPVLGWKESRAAVGVVRHALPLMRTSKNLDIVTVSKNAKRDNEVCEGMQIGQYLAAHGVTCQYYARRPGGNDKTPSDTLLRHAVQHQRDLIIIGGYSHSRLQEMLLGGMTRDLIKNSTVPVMLAHQ